MKTVMYILGVMGLMLWGVLLYTDFAYGVIHCIVVYTTSVVLYVSILAMFVYSGYHKLTYKRACCWYCLKGEHDTCRLSNTARIESLMYIQHKPHHN